MRRGGISSGAQSPLEVRFSPGPSGAYKLFQRQALAPVSTIIPDLWPKVVRFGRTLWVDKSGELRLEDLLKGRLSQRLDKYLGNSKTRDGAVKFEPGQSVERHLFQGPNGPMLHLHFVTEDSIEIGSSFDIRLENGEIVLGEVWAEQYPFYVQLTMLSGSVLDGLRAKSLAVISESHANESLRAALTVWDRRSPDPENDLGYSITRGQEGILFMSDTGPVHWDPVTPLYVTSRLDGHLLVFKRSDGKGVQPASPLDEARAILISWRRGRSARFLEDALVNPQQFQRWFESMGNTLHSFEFIQSIQARFANSEVDWLSAVAQRQSLYLLNLFKAAAAPHSNSNGSDTGSPESPNVPLGASAEALRNRSA
jgi:hypothetical protein